MVNDQDNGLDDFRDNWSFGRSSFNRDGGFGRMNPFVSSVNGVESFVKRVMSRDDVKSDSLPVLKDILATLVKIAAFSALVKKGNEHRADETRGNGTRGKDSRGNGNGGRSGRSGSESSGGESSSSAVLSSGALPGLKPRDGKPAEGKNSTVSTPGASRSAPTRVQLPNNGMIAQEITPGARNDRWNSIKSTVGDSGIVELKRQRTILKGAGFDVGELDNEIREKRNSIREQVTSARVTEEDSYKSTSDRLSKRIREGQAEDERKASEEYKRRRREIKGKWNPRKERRAREAAEGLKQYGWVDNKGLIEASRRKIGYIDSRPAVERSTRGAIDSVLNFRQNRFETKGAAERRFAREFSKAMRSLKLRRDAGLTTEKEGFKDLRALWNKKRNLFDSGDIRDSVFEKAIMRPMARSFEYGRKIFDKGLRLGGQVASSKIGVGISSASKVAAANLGGAAKGAFKAVSGLGRMTLGSIGLGGLFAKGGALASLGAVAAPLAGLVAIAGAGAYLRSAALDRSAEIVTKRGGVGRGIAGLGLNFNDVAKSVIVGRKYGIDDSTLVHQAMSLKSQKLDAMWGRGDINRRLGEYGISVFNPDGTLKSHHQTMLDYSRKYKEIKETQGQDAATRFLVHGAQMSPDQAEMIENYEAESSKRWNRKAIENAEKSKGSDELDRIQAARIAALNKTLQERYETEDLNSSGMGFLWNKVARFFDFTEGDQANKVRASDERKTNESLKKATASLSDDDIEKLMPEKGFFDRGWGSILTDVTYGVTGAALAAAGLATGNAALFGAGSTMFVGASAADGHIPGSDALHNLFGYEDTGNADWVERGKANAKEQANTMHFSEALKQHGIITGKKSNKEQALLVKDFVNELSKRTGTKITAEDLDQLMVSNTVDASNWDAMLRDAAKANFRDEELKKYEASVADDRRRMFYETVVKKGVGNAAFQAKYGEFTEVEKSEIEYMKRHEGRSYADDHGGKTLEDVKNEREAKEKAARAKRDRAKKEYDERKREERNETVLDMLGEDDAKITNDRNGLGIELDHMWSSLNDEDVAFLKSQGLMDEKGNETDLLKAMRDSVGTDEKGNPKVSRVRKLTDREKLQKEYLALGSEDERSAFLYDHDLVDDKTFVTEARKAGGISSIYDIDALTDAQRGLLDRMNGVYTHGDGKAVSDGIDFSDVLAAESKETPRSVIGDRIASLITDSQVNSPIAQPSAIDPTALVAAMADAVEKTEEAAAGADELTSSLNSPPAVDDGFKGSSSAAGNHAEKDRNVTVTANITFPEIKIELNGGDRIQAEGNAREMVDLIKKTVCDSMAGVLEER